MNLVLTPLIIDLKRVVQEMKTRINIVRVDNNGLRCLHFDKSRLKATMQPINVGTLLLYYLTKSTVSRSVPTLQIQFDCYLLCCLMVKVISNVPKTVRR